MDEWKMTAFCNQKNYKRMNLFSWIQAAHVNQVIMSLKDKDKLTF